MAGLVASAFFGGLEPAEKPEVPPAVFGETVDGGPWKVTVTGSRLVDELPGLRLADGNRWVAVLAVVENTDTESRSDFAEVLRLSGVEGLVAEQPKYVLLLRDASQPQFLNPGLAEKLAYLWEQKVSEPAPIRVRVDVWGRTYRRDTINDTMRWLDPEPRAGFEVPVEDRRKQ